LSAADPTFRGNATAMFSRPAYQVGSDHRIVRALADALERIGTTPAVTGASFWTDAAVLGHAGIPSVLFGPGGAGLHSVEEYVRVEDVLRCRDALAALVRDWCGGTKKGG